MKTKFITFFLVFSMIFACDNNNIDLEDGLYAEFKTSMGTMLIKLTYKKADLVIGISKKLSSDLSNYCKIKVKCKFIGY